MVDGRFYGLASQRIRPRNGSQIRSRKPAAGNKLPAISFVTGMGPMVRSSSEGFDQWAFAIDRTPLSLEKDAPVSRAVDRAGHILLSPNLGRTPSPICPDLIYGRSMSPPPAERDRIFFIAVSLVLNATNTSFAFGEGVPLQSATG